MVKKQAGFILLGVSVNLLIVTMLIAMVLSNFVSSISLHSRIREQERAAFFVANYLATGSIAEGLFVLREDQYAVDKFLWKKEIKVYKNDKLIFTAVTMESNAQTNHD